MSVGALLTWDFDEDLDEVTFFVPPEVDESTYPLEIDGTRVFIRKIPRPVAYDRLDPR
ncbi:hypothetical protein [Streptomyces kaniharaensis]|uniref:hypothetical protein n=1 Tax=Streptomyces kaniharaensis TaxID=212423 RepID=UPI0012952CCE|nr:hypothetical protein [Streptomyces kaniharaensis]